MKDTQELRQKANYLYMKIEQEEKALDKFIEFKKKNILELEEQLGYVQSQIEWKEKGFPNIKLKTANPF